MHANENDWTKDRIDWLLRLRSAGLTGSQIASRMGISRSAAIGKLYRLNGSKPVRESAKRNSSSIMKPSASSYSSYVMTSAVNTLRKISEKMEAASPPELPMKRAIPLVDLPENGCRWPVNDPAHGQEFLFCGDHKMGGKSYCRHHAELGVDRSGRRKIAQMDKAA